MAANNKRGRGKGLDGLIRNTTVNTPAAENKGGNNEGRPLMLDISKIKRDQTQPRQYFNEDKIQELADSILEHGMIEPLVVQKDGDSYTIITGERRWRAAKIADLKEVPVIVRSFSSPKEKLAIQIVENLQREDLNPIEVAKGYQRLKEEFNATDDEVAKTVGKSRAAVTNFIRLLRLDERVQQMVIDEKLSMGHVRTLLAIEDADKQYETAQNAFDNGYSVRELEKQVKKITAPAKNAKKKKEDLTQYQIHFDKYADLLAQRLGVKVDVDLKDKNQGKLIIDFYSVDDFDKIYERLSNEQQDT